MTENSLLAEDLQKEHIQVWQLNSHKLSPIPSPQVQTLFSKVRICEPVKQAATTSATLSSLGLSQVKLHSPTATSNNPPFLRAEAQLPVEIWEVGGSSRGMSRHLSLPLAVQLQESQRALKKGLLLQMSPLASA